MKHKTHKEGSETTENLYDFSGPLWSNYFHKTRSNARFPRSFREVFSVEDSDAPSEAY